MSEEKNPFASSDDVTSCNHDQAAITSNHFESAVKCNHATYPEKTDSKALVVDW